MGDTPQSRTDPRYIRPYIEVPATAFVVKDRFVEPPSRVKVLEIVQYIRKTGRAFDHPDLTHTKPPPGARVEYLEKFDLPEKFAQNPDLWLPCPVCSQHLPQFKVDGTIAWFPDEKVIRAIGGDCFKKLNPEGHAEALKKLQIDRKHRADERYLLSQLWAIPALRSDVEDDLRVGRAVDQTHRNLVRTLDAFDIPLWKLVRNGALEVERKTIQFVNHERRERMVRHRFATVRGGNLIYPDLKQFEIRLQQVAQALSILDFGSDWQVKLIEKSEIDKKQIAELLRDTMRQLSSAREAIEEARWFVRQETLATLRSWSRAPDCVCPFFLDFSLDGQRYVQIGLSESRSRKVLIPDAFFDPLAVLPSIPDGEVN